MKEATRILIVEDKSADADLAKYAIQKVLKDCEFRVVETQADFLNALEIFQPEVILSDYSLPHFDGMKALNLALKHAPLTPLIIWTGSIGEDVAVECMKAGANNYILKDNIKRLGPALIHALEERQLRLERRQVEKKYQTIFENSPEGIFQSTPDGRFINVNPALASIYGYDSPQDMLESITNIAQQIYIEPQEREEFTKLFEIQGSVINFEWRNYQKDRSIIWTSTSARAVRDDNGNILYYEGFLQDVTDRKRAEEALELSEKRFRALIENGLDDISLLAPDGTLLWESPSIVRNLGYPPDTFVGHNIFELMHPDDQEWTQKLYQKLIQEPDSREQGTFRLRHSDGTWRWVEAIATNMLNEPSVNAIVINYRDVTERKQTEEALRESQIKYRNLVETSHDLIWSIDADGRFTFINRAAREIYGYEPEELIGRSFFEIIDPEHYRQEDFKNFKETIARLDESKDVETYVRHRDGRQIILSANSIVLRDNDGNVIGVTGSSHDITIRKRVEDVLKEERNLLRTLIDNIPDRIYAMDIQGRKTLSNTADWKASGGKTMEDVIGKTDFDTYPPELAEGFWQLDKAVLDSGQSVINFEEPGLDFEGNPASILTTKIPLRDNDGKVIGLVGIGRDITERKQVEEKLQLSDQILQRVSALVLVADSQGNIVYVSPSAKMILGYEPEELLGDNWWKLSRSMSTEAQAEKEYVSRAAHGEVSIAAEAYERPIRDRWGNIHWISWVDTAGPGDLLIGVGHDVTERKQAEARINDLLAFNEKILNHSPLGILTYKLTGECVFANENAASIVGAEIEQLRTQNFHTIESWKKSGLYDLVEKAITTQAPVTADIHHVSTFGKDIWATVHCVTFKSKDEDHVLLSFSDITERKWAEEELRQSENRYRLATKATNDVIWEWNPITHQLLWAENAQHVFGYSAEEIGPDEKWWDEHIHPDDHERVLSKLNALIAGDELIWTEEYRFLLNDDSYAYISDHAYVERDVAGKPLRMIGAMANVTERQQSEEALRQSEARYRTLVESQTEFIVRWKPDGIRTFANEAYCRYFGLTPEQAVSASFMPLVYEQDRQAVEEKISRLISRVTNIETDIHRVIKSDGSIGWQEWTDQALYDEDGQLLELQSVGRDVTERKQIEQALKESQNKLEDAQRIAHLGYFEQELDTGVITLSDENYRILGLQPRGNLTISNGMELIHLEDREMVAQTLSDAIKTDQRFKVEYRIVRPDGEERFIYSEGGVTRDDSGHPDRAFGIAQDITERKRAEEALRESENRLILALAGAQMSVWEWNLQTNTIFWSPELFEITGVTRGDLDGTFESFTNLVHQDDVTRVRASAEKALANQSLFAEEFRIIRPDGEIRWLSNLGHAEYDSDHKNVRLIGTIQDITQRKRAELERQALLEIMQGLANTKDLQELLKLIHHSIAKVIYAENLFVVLYQQNSGLFEEIYSVDQYDPPAPPSKLEKSITSYIFRSGEPLLLNQENFDELVAQGEVELIGTNSASWLGIPLKTSGKTIGVIAVQDYVHSNRYSEREKDFLVSIAAQVALAIERKQAEDALHKSEALYRQAIEVAGAVPYYESYYDEGNSIKYEFIGEGIRQITGYGPEKFSAALWDSLVEEVNLVEDLAGYSLEEGIRQVRMGENSNWKCEHRLRDRDGNIHWVFEAAVELRDENGVSYGSIGTYQDITKRKQAEEAEREQRALAEALRDTAETLSSSLSYEEVLDHILAAVGRVVPHDAATVMLIEGESARVVRTYGYDQRGFDFEIMGIRLSLAKTNNMRQMLETGQPVVVYDTHAYPGWVRLEATDWLRSNVGAPISIQGKVIGFILLDSQTPGFFTPVHAERLEAFANQAAIAIHNSHLLKQAQEEITERKRAEEALRAEREKAQNYLDIAGVIMLALDQNGIVTLINQKGCEILGYPADEIIGKDWIKSFLPKTVKEELQGVFHKLISDDLQSAGYYENNILTKNGEERLIAWHNTQVRDSQGTIISTLSSGEDITERKRAEALLRASEERFRQLADNIQEVFWMTDAQSGEEIYISPAAEMIWERPVESLMHEPNFYLNSVFPEDQPALLRAMEKEKNGEKAEIEYRIIRPDGSIRWVWDRGFPIFDDSGKVNRIAGITADITERRESEIALIKSQSRYRELFDSSPISIWEEDYSLVKKRIDLLLESGVTNLREYLSSHPDEVTGLASLVRVTDVNKASLELYQVKHKDDLLNNLTQVMGTEPLNHFHEEILGLMSPLKNFVWEGADKTINGRRLEVIVNGSLPEGYEEDWSKVIVSIIDITERRQAEQQLRKLSRAVEQSASSIVITNTSGTIEYVNPRFTKSTGYAFEEVIGQNPRILKSGQTTVGEYKQLWQTITSGKEWHGELLNKKKNDELFWEYVTISPIFNEHGEITHFVGIMEDITQRKEDEIEISRHMAELEALYENGLAVGRLLKPKEIGNRVIDTFARYLPWHHVTIRLRKGQTDDLELIAFNLPELQEEKRTETEQHFIARINKVGQGLSGWVMQTGEPICTGNVHNHPQYVDTHAGIQSGLYVPLRVGEQVIGVISVESEEADAFTDQDQRLLATMANQAAIALENARLYQAIEQELLERERAQDALRVSETHYRELADSITDILFELDQKLQYTHWNKASEALIGLPATDVIGKSMHEIFGESEEQARIGQIYESVLKNHQPKTFETTLPLNGQKRSFEINAYPSTRGVSVVAKDVTDRKRSETIMQKRFELMEYSAHHTLNELMQRTVDEVSDLTGSTIGFFHFVDADQIAMGMQTWSTSALQLFNVPLSEGTHRSLDQAGLWAEAARQRRPLIQNDFESLTKKKDLPQGHVAITREIIIPIIRNERIMAVMGIANKPQDYTQHDLEIAERLADYAWDITERKQMEMALEVERNQLAQRVDERTADLSRANSNLARALRVKDEFLANMSHELRTPLNAILGLSESLGEQIAGPLNEKQQKYIATIGESGHHLLSLINDILDLAKIDAGQITLDINKVDIHSVCQASLRMIKQLAQKKNQEVSLEIDEGLGLMWADERRLKQMIVNLLGNAVKFTPENGKLGLEVHGDEEANKISFTVWDKGIGIKEEDLARLFQPFVQLDSGLARETTGTGLGLALVAQMARLHGGSIITTSEPENGSRFTIVLPWEPALAMDAAARMKITGKFRAIKLDEKNKPIILLVEDTKEVTMMIKDYLELTGYKVVTAQDGVDAIVQAKLVRPDLILMDIQMPRMDGFEATRKLRSEPDFRYTPIIALTALAMPNDRQRCLEAGMDEYITKPVNLKALVKIIQACLFSNQEIKS